MKDIFKILLAKFLNVLYPPKCISCNRNVDDIHVFCQRCWARIEFISSPSCKKCCIPLPTDYLGEKCGKCIEFNPIFDKCISIFRYDNFTKKLIHDFKFNDKSHYGKSFAKLIIRKAGRLIYEADLILAVPMHKINLRLRKYNHALLIVKNICKLSDKPFNVDLLVKSKQSPSQIGLSRSERMRNLDNTFSITKSSLIKGKVIVLVDDVMTTGATANECAKTLRKAGAKRVNIVTVARTYS